MVDEMSKLNIVDDFYKIDYKKVGPAIIVNYEDYKDPKMKRTGSRNDVKRLGEQLQSLGFKVTVYNDCSPTFVYEEIEKITERLDKTGEVDALVCAFFAHASDAVHQLRSINKMIFSLEDKIDLIHECHALKNKPKVFIMQTCRGQMADIIASNLECFDSMAVEKFPEDYPVENVDEQGRYRTAENSPVQNVDKQGSSITTHKIQVQEDGVDVAIPTGKDLLFSYACVKGYTAWRDKNGSRFIQTLCDVMDKKKYKHDFCSILTDVSKEVSKETMAVSQKDGTEKHVFQLPCYTSMLTKKIQFEEPSPDYKLHDIVMYNKGKLVNDPILELSWVQGFSQNHMEK